MATDLSDLPSIIKRLKDYIEENILKLTASKSDQILQSNYVF